MTNNPVCPGAPICMGDCHACVLRRGAISKAAWARAPHLVTDEDHAKRQSIPDLIRDYATAKQWHDEAQESQQIAAMAVNRIIERLAEVLLEKQGIPAPLIRRVADHHFCRDHEDLPF